MPFTLSEMSAKEENQPLNGRSTVRPIRTIEILYPRRLIIDIDAFNIALHLANEKLTDGTVGFGTLV